MLVVGFPSPFTDYITAGNMYSGTKPAGSETKTRSIGLVGSVNYSYDNRYLFDFTYRANASSQLGTDDRWGHFWSVGLGWNIHHEKFMASLPFINVFKVRGSLGYTGSEISIPIWLSLHTVILPIKIIMVVIGGCIC